MQILNKNTKNNNHIYLLEKPVTIKYETGKPSNAVFHDGHYEKLACMKCEKPKCFKFFNGEYTAQFIPSFSFEQSEDVCPVGAISIDKETRIPIFDFKKCILCGSCIRRCPVGAIYFDKEIKVNNKLTESQIFSNEKKSNFISPEEIECKKLGCAILENQNIFTEIYNKLSFLHPSFHNLIVRNIFISLNCEASVRRIGDVYTRIDAIYKSNEQIGSIEIEFGKDSLSASRSTLDDIAVLNIRHNLSKKIQSPIVVFMNLPNTRQGYWQVIKDIKNVEGISISTYSLAALFILNWNFKDLINNRMFYLDYDDTNIRKRLEYILGRKLNAIPLKFLGLLEPEK